MLQSAARWAYGQAWLVLVATTLLWGLNAIASRVAIGNVTPMSLVFMRWLGVCVLLVLFLWRDLARNLATLRAHWKYLLAMGAFGFTAFTVMFYEAAHYTSAVNLVLLQTGIPLFVLGGAALFRGERIGLMQIIGMAVMFIGVALIATRGEPWRLSEISFNIGDMLVIGSCVFYAAYTIGLRDRPPLPPLIFFSALAFAACLSSFPFMIGELALGQFHWPTAKGWWLMVFVTLGPSLASQLLFMRGVELIGPGRAGLYTNLTPIFGAIFAVLLLSEPFHVYHAIAMALTLAGIWISERK